MGERRCGYCRDYNHMAPECPTRLGQIDMLARHVGAERRRIVEMLIASGFGEGAIVNAYNYRTGDYGPAIISDPNDAIEWNSLDSPSNLKYCKQVRTMLQSFSGYWPAPSPNIKDYDRLMLFRVMQDVNVKAYFLSNGADEVNVSIHVSQMDKSYLTGNQANTTRPNWSWSRPTELLSPSTDGQVDMARVLKPYRLPDRLKKGGKVTPKV